MILKKPIFLLFIFILFSSCSNLEPLYVQKDKAQKKIFNMRILPIEGRYGVFLKNELEETFGRSDDNQRESLVLKTKLEVGTTSVESFNIDGTGSRFNASVIIEYILYEPDGCAVFSESVSTTASFNSKSDGYDFGNKASERMAIKRNIEYNVKKVYPRIYHEIKSNKKSTIRPVAPFIGIENKRWC
tara:strand:+ start:2314 stop:2874 length:561 start_codon:yes stop_codon:yes gene_type:complete